MALSQKLVLRQGVKLGQNLSLTRQLLQAIKLLQMNQAELAEFVESEIERNPLLEREDGSEVTLAPPSQEDSHVEDDWLNTSQDAGDMAATFDMDVENLFPEDDREAAPVTSEWATDDSPYWQQTGTDGSEAVFDNAASDGETLVESLTRQLHLTEQDLQHRFIGQQLIECVDETGYVTSSLDELAIRLGVSIDDVLHVLTTLQSFEPAGICARNLAECLALQLKDKNRFDPAMQKLTEHLDLLGKGDIAALRRICGVDAEDLADMIAEIRQLDPKPGAAFTIGFSETLIPDVHVRRGRAGEWVVELNSDALPRLLVNERYAAKINSTARTREEKTYISSCLQNANWLAKSLDQRAKTVLKVASEIVIQQQDFFEQGVNALKPMLMRDIAAAIDMHESTVSRVTAGKHMTTPRGVFEFRYFFTTALGTNTGNDISSESVRQKIRTLVDNEHAGNVLSDDAIVTLMQEDGIHLARRTVAKYRDMMGIPSSASRKRQKRSRA